MITIVIATYGEHHWAELALSRALPSAQRQHHGQIIVHHEPHLEIGPARNAAAANATGEWLLFLDADDELDPGYIDAMTKAIEEHPGTVLFQPAVVYVRKGRRPTPMVMPAKDLRSDNFLVIGTLIQRSLFEKVGGFSDYPHGFEDWSLWAKAWKAGAAIIPVPDAVYVAHVNPRSKHRQMWRDRKTQVANHIRIAAELFPEGS